MRSAKQFLFGSLGTALAVTGLVALAPAPVQAASTGLIINEVYGGGGSTSASAAYKADFVELYNPTGGPLPLDGLSLQYRSSAFSGTGSVSVLPLPDADVPAGSHYLVQTSSGICSGNPCGGADVPSPDFSGTALNMAATNGQVVLVQGTDTVTATGTSMHTVANVVDFVGYGTATSSETAPTGTATANTSSVQRSDFVDNDNNATDYAAPATPTPENSGPVVPTPVEAGTRADINVNVGATFPNITLQASGGTPPLTWEAGGLPPGISISEGGALSGTPTVEGEFDVTATVTDSADPVTTDDVTFKITVSEALEIRAIAEVQGTGPRSTFAPAEGTALGETVRIQGVVTAMYREGGFNGMYVQTAGTGGTTDATPDASDAIFVWGNSSMPAGVTIGDSVDVTGRVSEFAGLTEITPSSGGVFELEAPLAAVSPLEIAYPSTEEARESQEGMLLQPTDTFTVSNVYSTNQYGEVGLATGDQPLMQPTEVADDDDAAGLQAVKDDNFARGVILDDGSTVNYLQNQTNKGLPVPWLTNAQGDANPIRVGAEATLVAPVILDYRNSNWKFQPRSQVTTNGADVATFEDTRPDNLVPQDVGGDLKIATFNVLNYFNTTGEAYVLAGPLQNPPVDTHCTYYTDREGNRIGNNQCGTRGVGIDPPNDGRGPRGAATAASVARQEAKLAHTINALDADIIGLEEIESSIKLVGETNRDDALARLVQIANEASAPGTWAYVRSPGEATAAAGVAEQDVIRGAFMYKVATVETVGQSDILFGTTEFANAREPVAQAFKAKGAPDTDAFAVIVNHFKSKGDNRSPAPPASGDNENNEFTGAFNGDRTRQAQRLVEFADEFAADHDIEAVFLAGDFNAYTMEDPIGELQQGGFEIIESDTEGDESYSFSGFVGSLDHVLGNEAALDMVTGSDIWEINANEAISFQYSRFNYNVTDFWQPNNPFATSDHNPHIIGIDVPSFTPTTYKEIQVLGTNDFHGRLLPDGGNAAGAAPFASAVEELKDENPNTVFVAAGDLVGASTFESFIQDDEPTIDALNAMGLEVSAAGNHEFDRGYDELAGRIQDLANWEYIAANIEYDAAIAEEDRLAETWTKTIDGVEVGFVGAVTEDLPALVNPDGITGITVTDVVDATNDAAAALKADGADVVVLLVHEGSPTTSCNSPSFTDPATVWGNISQNASADVDAIISGHTHLAYNCKYTVDEWVDGGRAVTKRPVVSAGQYGTNLNKLVFKFDEGTGVLAAVTQEILPVAGVGYGPDPDVQAIVDDAVAVAATEGNVVLGAMEGPFERATYNPQGVGTENRGGESTLNNQVAEVQRWATAEAGIATDIAFMNPGGLRADMDGTVSGDVRELTFRQAADVQPFANTLVNMKLTGAQLEIVLEQQWQRNAQGGVPSRPFLRLGVSDGFTYTYEQTPETVSVPNAAPVETFRGEVTGMWLDGEPIDAAQVYSVTVNSFLGTGGDNFWELANGADKVDTGKVDLEAMVDYMAQYDAANPLPVDYSQRAVELDLPDDAPAVYAPGDEVSFDVGSWAMSADGDLEDADLQVKLGDEVLGTFPVDNTIGDRPYDDYGTASVTVTLPANTPSGVRELTVFGPTTKSAVPLFIEVDATREIQILGTNDFHGRLLPNAGSREAGAAVLSGAVKQLREDNPNTIFAAAGDLIGASTFESFIQHDKPTIDALNEAGLDVSAVGNHELDAGYDDLVDRVMAAYDADTNPEGGVEWQYIAANLKMKVTGDDAVPATWIKTVDGVEVGFVGAVTEELPALVSPAGIADIEALDIVDTVNAEAADLKSNGAEIVVMLVHEGSASTSCTSPQFTDESTTWGNITQNVSADVDAIVSGHTHLAYDCSFPVDEWVTEGRAVTERPVVSSGQYGMNLNQLVFSVDETGVVGLETAVLPLMTTDPDGSGPLRPTPLYPADPAVTAIVDAAVSESEALGAQVLGKIAGPFDRARWFGLDDDDQPAVVENRGGESTLGNKVAEVQRWATESEESGGAQIAFMNPGGLRADMRGVINGDARDLSYKQAAGVQPFANTLVNMDLTGAQIETLLEQQWQRTSAGAVPTRPFLRLGVSEGFTYTYVETPTTVLGTETLQGEITGMWLNGEPIEDATTYSVTVNSFLASGGDNFREFTEGTGRADTGKIDLQAMVDYMAQFDTDPLAVDHSQRAVEVAFPADAPASYPAGGTVSFDVGSWSMTGASDVVDTEIQVKLGDEVLATVPVVNGDLPTTPYDQYGSAEVDATLPDSLTEGTAELTLVGAQTGTSIIVPIGVSAPAPGEVVNDTAPTVSGAARVGRRLTASDGSWTPTPTTTTYQWLANGAPIPGATRSTLVLKAAQVGKRISVRVTAQADGFTNGTAVSAQTARVVKGNVTLHNRIAPTRVVVNRTRVTLWVRPVNVDGIKATGKVLVRIGGKTWSGTLVDGRVGIRLGVMRVPGLKRVYVRYMGNASLAQQREINSFTAVR